MWGNGNNRPAQNQVQPPAVNQPAQPNQTATAPQPADQFSRARNNADRNQSVATAPSSPTPADNNRSARRAAPVQNPAVAVSPQPAPVQSPQTQTPRNANRNDGSRQNVVVQSPVVAPPANYSAPQPASQPRQQIFNQPRNEVRQNYSQPVVNASPAPQQAMPGAAPAQPSSQWSGGRSQSWGAR